MQAIVDADKKFRQYSIRPGSFNDQMILNLCPFRRNVNQILPAGLVLLGDAGYKIMSWLMVPFDDTSRTLSAAETLYVYCASVCPDEHTAS